MSPEAWGALATIAGAVCGLLGLLIRETQQTRRTVGETKTAVGETKTAVVENHETTTAARDEAARAAAQTVATGNGHADRVEGGLSEVLDRLTRIEDAGNGTRADVAELRERIGRIEESSSGTRADVAEIRGDVGQVRDAITRHLQDHAAAELTRRAG